MAAHLANHLFIRLILGTSGTRCDREKEHIIERLREVDMPADYVIRLARILRFVLGY